MAGIEAFSALGSTDSISVAREPIEWHRQDSKLIKPEPHLMVTDEAIVREIGHLNDQQLEDIGIRRKWRAPSWRAVVRRIATGEVCEFDYFWLDN